VKGRYAFEPEINKFWKGRTVAITINKTTLAAGITLMLLLALGLTQTAQAHTSFVIDATSIPYAGKSYTGTLRAGHGCEDEVTGDHYDTEKVEVEIPAGVTKVKPFDAPWGAATIEKDMEGNVTKLIWTRNSAALAEDTHLYAVSFRATLPDAPLTTVSFRAVQICNGGTIETAWEGAEAPTLNLVPARLPGWNKYTIDVEITDEAMLKQYFGDALIVWSNDAAYSANPVTAELIDNKLISVPANQEIWVKY
jgi:uncharacterized protein YcnI